jgi:hypothetical protein
MERGNLIERGEKNARLNFFERDARGEPPHVLTRRPQRLTPLR